MSNQIETRVFIVGHDSLQKMNTDARNYMYDNSDAVILVVGDYEDEVTGAHYFDDKLLSTSVTKGKSISSIVTGTETIGSLFRKINHQQILKTRAEDFINNDPQLAAIVAELLKSQS